MSTMRQPIFQEIPYHEPIKVFSRISEKKGCIFFDSATHKQLLYGTNRYSYIALSPFKIITIKNYICLEDKQAISNPFYLIKNYLNQFKLEKIKELPPFQGGIAGFFSYDLCHYIEKIPYPLIDDMNFPDLAIGFYDVVISFDHEKEKSWIISTGFPEQTINLQKKLAKIRLNATLNLIKNSIEETQYNQFIPEYSQITSNFDKSQYLKTVEKVKDYILAGDVFEVNLSQRFKSQLSTSITPYLLYQQLRTINPAPYAAYMQFNEMAIVSASPERFILLNNHHVETRPIKGTVPRGKTAIEDKQLADELVQCKKNHSENIMIVDLMRNDLSRVCEDHSVLVEKLCGLESYATVHHLVSVITGKLREGISAIDLLAESFPGGSITGAPKIRAMQIIAELEPNRRGPYCGNLGFISFCGDMETSILIRTFVIHKNIVTYQTGGAVVLDSDPEKEYQETLHKAAALNKALMGNWHGHLNR